MRPIRHLLVATAAAGAVALSACSTLQSDVVAVVGDQEISLEEFNEIYQLQIAFNREVNELEQLGHPDEVLVRSVRDGLLWHLVDVAATRQQFEALELEVAEDSFDAYVALLSEFENIDLGQEFDPTEYLYPTREVFDELNIWHPLRMQAIEQADFLEAVEACEQIEIQVASRFGSWNDLLDRVGMQFAQTRGERQCPTFGLF